jgi:hypothetical protein
MLGPLDELFVKKRRKARLATAYHSRELLVSALKFALGGSQR